ncbi:hypothetical protein [Variovorax boronicumulans]|uniref:hypothetical protein n=1 Tax=Variovorax boronicumulans TaxID=436515 RepID=UPI0012E4B529|nr:hypothetical protein [Variovorax boronicumulans]GER16731.1 hypothetical protein VCH24_17380 [Variovorax boronicumulans]
MSPPEFICATPFPAVPAVRETGVLFQPEMARATFAGIKTQTRRLFKLPNGFSWYDELGGEAAGWMSDDTGPGWWHIEELTSPYGAVGDRIWGREAYRTIKFLDSFPPRNLALGAPIFYEASPEPDASDRPAELGKYRPGMFMCRWMSRIVRELTHIRIERLLDITEEDAIAEGIQPYRGPLRWVRYLDAITGEPIHKTARDAYLALWDHINGAGAAAANPRVWAYTFKDAT